MGSVHFLALLVLMLVAMARADSGPSLAEGKSETVTVGEDALAAVRRLKVGLSEAEVVTLLRPHVLDARSESLGGVGGRLLYFQLGARHQIRVGIDCFGKVAAFGSVELKTSWKYAQERISLKQ